MLEKYETSQRDEHEVARITKEMKTVCIGRFSIEMPVQAQVKLGQARINGFNIVAFEESTEEFQRRLADREAQIKAKPDRLGGNKNLESVREIETAIGVFGKLFVHSSTVTEGSAAKGLELERYRYEGVAVEALVHAMGISIDLAADDYYPDRIQNLTKLNTGTSNNGLVPSSLSDGAALGLWDKITSSIRLRVSTPRTNSRLTGPNAAAHGA